MSCEIDFPKSGIYWFCRGVQNPVRGEVKEQTQPATAQGLMGLHVSPQVIPLASLRNWRRETAPEYSAEATMVTNKAVLAIFVNIPCTFRLKTWEIFASAKSNLALRRKTSPSQNIFFATQILTKI